jgi:hypothetical protein
MSTIKVDEEVVRNHMRCEQKHGEVRAANPFLQKQMLKDTAKNVSEEFWVRLRSMNFSDDEAIR